MLTQNDEFASKPHIVPPEGESKLLNKIKHNPLLPIATTVFVGIAAFRIYQAKNRGGQKLSFYLIHTRLAAQGFAVACLAGMAFYPLGERLYNNYIRKR